MLRAWKKIEHICKYYEKKHEWTKEEVQNGVITNYQIFQIFHFSQLQDIVRLLCFVSQLYEEKLSVILIVPIIMLFTLVRNFKLEAIKLISFNRN